MFVAILVAMLATGDMHTEVGDTIYHSADECNAFVAKLDAKLADDVTVAAFAAKCVEITHDDVKGGGASA